MNIKYNTAKNVYYRRLSNESNNSTNAWSSLAFAYSNIQLKVESDWKMCYLARTEGSKEAFIEWAFDFSENIRVQELSIKCKTDCFESGEVNWSIINENGGEIIPIEILNGNLNVVRNLSGFSKFKVRVDMRKGNGPNAFQHTQLFRQKLDDVNVNLFEMDFILQ